MSEASGRLSKILVEDFNVDSKKIEAGITLDDLGVDSVAMIELIDILKENLDIKIGDEELTNKNTVGHVIDTIESKAGA